MKDVPFHKAIPMSNGPTGKLLDEFVAKFNAGTVQLWEQRLKLYLRPRPWCVPAWLWRLLIGRVLVQTVEGRRVR